MTALGDPHRLPITVLPSAYRLRLEPFLDSASFTGTVEIDLEITAPSDTIVLNAYQLEIEPPALTSADGARTIGTATIDEENQRATIVFPTTLGLGAHTLTMSFAGVLNDELAGFYRSTFEDEQGVTHTIATTQMEMTDARRAFPCFDEPGFKATFQVTLVVPGGMAAFSNSAPVEEHTLEDGRREVVYGPTMRMSTYLVAFVVGPFLQTDPRDVDGVPLTVVCRAGREHLTKFALEVAEFSLRAFKEYFEIPYPGDKVDLIGIPDFGPGAMENLGCVTFRETELLVDADTASQDELVRIAIVIAHELAHMWFGDLVTMAWWEGLWLNEAFATFMSYVCIDQFRPEWKMWVRFEGEREVGMLFDAGHGTRPIEFPVRLPAEAIAMADPITYQKGSSVLRMLEQFLSPGVFRDGIRHYLRAHSYANAVTSDLWASLESVSGRPVGEILDTWILQGGHPIVSVGSGELTQRPFMLCPPEGDSAIGSGWIVPILSRPVESRELSTHLLREGGEPIEVPPATLVNAGGAGVYRTSYEPDRLAEIVDRLDALTEVERAVLVGDTCALLHAGDRSIVDALAIASRLGNRIEPQVWETLDLLLLDFLDRVVTDEERPILARKVRSLMEPLFERLGWDAEPGEDERTHILRATLIRRLGTTGANTEIRKEAIRRFDAGDVEGDLAPAVITVVGSLNRPGDYEEMIRRFREANDPQTETRYRDGIAAFTDEAMIMRAYAEVFDIFRLQDAPLAIFRLVANRVAGLPVWSAIADNWEAVTERVPAQLQVMVGVGLIFQVADLDTVARVKAFHREHVLPAGQQMISQALENFDASSRLAVRERSTLASALA
jgi:puromycin-sensitive aminopeptidase